MGFPASSLKDGRVERRHLGVKDPGSVQGFGTHAHLPRAAKRRDDEAKKKHEAGFRV